MTRRPKKKVARKPPPTRRRIAANAKLEKLDDFIAAGARALDLTIDKSWMPTVRTHLQVTLTHGTRVASFALADDAEPAAVFKA